MAREIMSKRKITPTLTRIPAVDFPDRENFWHGPDRGNRASIERFGLVRLVGKRRGSIKVKMPTTKMSLR